MITKREKGPKGRCQKHPEGGGPSFLGEGTDHNQHF